MDISLSKREIELARLGRDFFEQVLAPLEILTDEHGELPKEQRKPLREQVVKWGLAGINHSKEDGGLGLTMLEQVVIEEQLGRATNGLWTCVWRPPVSLKYGTAKQKQDYLVPSNTGDRRGAFAITEPNAGSDNSAVTTSAVLENGRWRLNGEKWFVTSYNASDFIIVHAHVDGDPGKPTLFLVDSDADGVVHLRSPKFMHNYAFDHAELRFDDVLLAEDRMLGEIGQGFELTKRWFVEARLQIACHTLGAATRALDVANEFAAGRVQFGRPIRDFQAIEFMLADMAVDIYAGNRCFTGWPRKWTMVWTKRSSTLGQARSNCSAPRWQDALSTRRSRSWVAGAICATLPWSGSIATSAWTVSGRVLPKSSGWS